MASDLDATNVVFALARSYVNLTAQSVVRKIWGETPWPFPEFQTNQKVRYNDSVWVVENRLEGDTGSYGGYGNIPKYTLKKPDGTTEIVLGARIYGEEPDKTNRCVAYRKQSGDGEGKVSEPMLEVYRSKTTNALGLLEVEGGDISLLNPTLVEIVHTPPSFVAGDHVVVRTMEAGDLYANVEIATFSPDVVRYPIQYKNTTDHTEYMYRLKSDKKVYGYDLRLHRKRDPVECGNPPSPAEGPQIDYNNMVWVVQYPSTPNKSTVDWDDFRDVVVSSPYSHSEFEGKFQKKFESPLYLCTPSKGNERLMQENELVGTPVFRWRAGMCVDILPPGEGKPPLSPDGSYAYDDDATVVSGGGGDDEIMDMSTYQRIRQSVWTLKAGQRKTYNYGEIDSRLETVVDAPSYVPQWNLRSSSGVALSSPLPAPSGHHAKPTKAAQKSSNRMSGALSFAARLGRGALNMVHDSIYGYRLVGKIISVDDNAVADVLLRVPLGNSEEVMNPSKNTSKFYEATVRIRLDVPATWEDRKRVTTRPVDSDDGDISYIQLLYPK